MRFFRKSEGDGSKRRPAEDPFALLVELSRAAKVKEREIHDFARSCRSLARPVYLGEYAALCRVLGVFKLFVDTRDIGFACQLLLEGFWEPELTLCVARYLRPGMTAIDVGANYGYYTLLMGELVGAEGSVYSVEPNPRAAAMLRRSVDLNGMATRTTVIEAAAGAADDGEVLLYVPHNEPKNASIVVGADSAPPDSGTLHHVAQVTVDNVAARAKRVDFIKIDVEGTEEAVIAGLGKVLRRDKPCLVLEFNAARCRDADALLGALGAIYGAIHYLDPYGNEVETTATQLKTQRFAEDWLLFFDNPTGLNQR
jgi:FkbM family methyltransferase